MQRRAEYVVLSYSERSTFCLGCPNFRVELRSGGHVNLFGLSGCAIPGEYHFLVLYVQVDRAQQVPEAAFSTLLREFEKARFFSISRLDSRYGGEDSLVKLPRCAMTLGLAPTCCSLNKLIEVCLDGELGYRTAAKHIHDTKLQIVLSDFATTRSQFAEQLRAEVERLGRSPSGSGSMSASFHRGWITLKSAVSGGSPRAIVAACETGEDSARASYEAIVHSDLSGPTRSLVENQWHAVEQARERMRQIQDQLASGVE